MIPAFDRGHGLDVDLVQGFGAVPAGVIEIQFGVELTVVNVFVGDRSAQVGHLVLGRIVDERPRAEPGRVMAHVLQLPVGMKPSRGRIVGDHEQPAVLESPDRRVKLALGHDPRFQPDPRRPVRVEDHPFFPGPDVIPEQPGRFRRDPLGTEGDVHRRSGGVEVPYGVPLLIAGKKDLPVQPRVHQRHVGRPPPAGMAVWKQGQTHQHGQRPGFPIHGNPPSFIAA